MVFAEGDVDKRYDEKSTLFEQIKACFNKKRSNTEPDRLTNEYDFSTILIGIINSLIKKKRNEEREGN